MRFWHPQDWSERASPPVDHCQWRRAMPSVQRIHGFFSVRCRKREISYDILVSTQPGIDETGQEAHDGIDHPVSLVRHRSC